MSVDLIDVLAWGWFIFVAWAAIREWHSVHPGKERHWPRHTKH